MTPHKPTVTVVAGPNGAGKSSLQSLLRQARLVNCNIVNIDALEIDVDTLPNDMLRYEYEKSRRTDQKFKELCEEAISNHKDFSFECNLREEQVKYLQLFEDAGYEINLVFIWLDCIETSYKRVEKRVANGGHEVGKKSITRNFYEGLKNLDECFDGWNNVYIIDNSKDSSLMKDGEVLPLMIYVKDAKVLYVTKNISTNVLARDFPHIMKAYQS